MGCCYSSPELVAKRVLEKRIQEALQVIINHRRQDEEASVSFNRIILKFPLLRNAITSLRAIFTKYDNDGSDSIDKEEFGEAMRGLGAQLPEEELEHMFLYANLSNQNKGLRFRDFVVALCLGSVLQWFPHLRAYDLPLSVAPPVADHAGTARDGTARLSTGRGGAPHPAGGSAAHPSPTAAAAAAHAPRIIAPGGSGSVITNPDDSTGAPPSAHTLSHAAAGAGGGDTGAAPTASTSSTGPTAPGGAAAAAAGVGPSSGAAAGASAGASAGAGSPLGAELLEKGKRLVPALRVILETYVLFDRDGSGTIDRDEVLQMIDTETRKQATAGRRREGGSNVLLSKERWMELDVDDSGEVSFAEFVSAVMRWVGIDEDDGDDDEVEAAPAPAAPPVPALTGEGALALGGGAAAGASTGPGTGRRPASGRRGSRDASHHPHPDESAPLYDPVTGAAMTAHDVDRALLDIPIHTHRHPGSVISARPDGHGDGAHVHISPTAASALAAAANGSFSDHTAGGAGAGTGVSPSGGRSVTTARTSGAGVGGGGGGGARTTLRTTSQMVREPGREGPSVYGPRGAVSMRISGATAAAPAGDGSSTTRQGAAPHSIMKHAHSGVSVTDSVTGSAAPSARRSPRSAGGSAATSPTASSGNVLAGLGRGTPPAGAVSSTAGLSGASSASMRAMPMVVMVAEDGATTSPLTPTQHHPAGGSYHSDSAAHSPPAPALAADGGVAGTPPAVDASPAPAPAPAATATHGDSDSLTTAAVALRVPSGSHASTGGGEGDSALLASARSDGAAASANSAVAAVLASAVAATPSQDPRPVATGGETVLVTHHRDGGHDAHDAGDPAAATGTGAGVGAHGDSTARRLDLEGPTLAPVELPGAVSAREQGDGGATLDAVPADATPLAW